MNQSEAWVRSQAARVEQAKAVAGSDSNVTLEPWTCDLASHRFSAAFPMADDAVVRIRGELLLASNGAWIARGMPHGESPRKVAPQSSSTLVVISESTDLESVVGHQVELAGRVVDTEPPRVFGVSVDGADIPGDPRNRFVRLRGVIRKSVITEADVDANRRNPLGPAAMPGAGTYYRLEAVEVISIED
jgi:hypothetical protein